MSAEATSTCPAAAIGPPRPLPGLAQAFLPPATLKSRIARIFEPAIVTCMREARRPSGLDIQSVAAKIWHDVQTGNEKIPWRGLAPGCTRYRTMIAAARAALGAAEDKVEA